MADKSICKIEGCGKHSKRRGWCQGHYDRWRKYGSPLGGRTPNGEPERFLREVVLPYDGNECLLWPYGKTAAGYGTVNDQFVHRIACEEENGPPLSAEHEAAHSCGNGRLGCVTRRHLRWELHIENMKNLSIRSDNTSGQAGVYWSKRAKKWIARINSSGASHYLGCFNDIADAIAVREDAEIRYGYHPNHGKMRTADG